MFFYMVVALSAVAALALDLDINTNISSVTLYGNRFFLTTPRLNASESTIIETTWPNFILKKWRPNQTWSKCKHVQNAISLEIDEFRARLWILDAGNTECPPKISIYNLYRQELIVSRDLSNTVGTNLTMLAIDNYWGNSRAYVGTKNNILGIFDLSQMKWWQTQLNSGVQEISTEFIAISRKNSVLYTTGSRELGIFSLDLNKMRQDEGPLPVEESIQDLEVKYLGDKLGISSGLIVDFKEALIYYLIRDYAVVEWNPKSPALAEYSNIIMQSYESLPYIKQFFRDQQNAIWALVEFHQTMLVNGNNKTIADRFVKILKFWR